MLLADAQINFMTIVLSWQLIRELRTTLTFILQSQPSHGLSCRTAGEQAFCIQLSDYLHGMQMRGTRTSISSMTS